MSEFNFIQNADGMGFDAMAEEYLDYSDSLWQAENILFSGEVDEESGIQMFDTDSGSFSKEYKDFLATQGESVKSYGGGWTDREMYYHDLKSDKLTDIGKRAADPFKFLDIQHLDVTSGDVERATSLSDYIFAVDHNDKMFYHKGKDKAISPYRMLQIFLERKKIHLEKLGGNEMFDGMEADELATKDLKTLINKDDAIIIIRDKP